MARKVIDVRAEFPVTPAQLYAVLREGARWPELTPLGSFELYRPGETEPEGVGAIRLFRTPPFASYEQIVELEPDRRFSYTLLRGLPLRDYRVDATLTPVGGGTELHWHCEFTPKIPGTGWFYRWFFGYFHAKVVAGLGAGATA
ncbi:SRPBCC family protein [Amycolatopsis sp. YIM 10]|uniref:SRPBCC family protein n=1 Tax=Amycolatopsis sp. YIM 10 TaxID=2653857 RepID=UPI0012903B1E|nr:SRPBCC family protein [Amycolatopsis sp. YIM 10]